MEVSMKLKRAEEMIQSLDRSALVEFKTMNNPPVDVVTVFGGLCLVMGMKQNFDTTKKRLLSNPSNLM